MTVEEKTIATPTPSVSTPPAESIAVLEAASKELEKQTQVEQPIQEAGAPQVEGPLQTPASKPEERPKPSTFYADRKKIKKLESMVSTLHDKLSQLTELQKKQS